MQKKSPSPSSGNYSFLGCFRLFAFVSHIYLSVTLYRPMMKTVKCSFIDGWPRYPPVCFDDGETERSPSQSGRSSFAPVQTLQSFSLSSSPSAQSLLSRWETFLVIKFFRQVSEGGLDSMRRMQACESWYLSLSLSLVPPLSLHSASISLLCIVLLHQGTYDLWAHLSAIIKQSLMKSRKVTSSCTRVCACGIERLILARAYLSTRVT